MNYIFYGFDMRFPNKKKDVIVNASSLSDAKSIMQTRSPFFYSICIYPDLSK